MKLSSLARMLSAGMPAADFVREIEPELAEHLRGLAKRGGVAPVRVEEDHPLVFDQAGLATLCSRFAAGDLTAEQLASLDRGPDPSVHTVDVLDALQMPVPPMSMP